MAGRRGPSGTSCSSLEAVARAQAAGDAESLRVVMRREKQGCLKVPVPQKQPLRAFYQFAGGLVVLETVGLMGLRPYSINLQPRAYDLISNWPFQAIPEPRHPNSTGDPEAEMGRNRLRLGPRDNQTEKNIDINIYIIIVTNYFHTATHYASTSAFDDTLWGLGMPARAKKGPKRPCFPHPGDTLCVLTAPNYGGATQGPSLEPSPTQT